jgi:DNA polymerase I-like protein with 3'-5' exonuclease and polymerase domains
MEKVMQIHKAGWQVVLRVHDEVVCEVPEDRVDEAKAQILQIMKASPTFAPDLPLDSSVNSAKTYYEAK